MSEAMISYKRHLIDVKPRPLLNISDWTTHFAIYYDLRDQVEPVRNIHMGNACNTEQEAFDAGLVEARRIIDRFEN